MVTCLFNCINLYFLGNCLFNALSDQLYGHQHEHANIRSRVISYMREHAAYYKQFIDVNPGGGIRRNPKRKNVNPSGYASSSNFVPPSAADIDRVFDSHLQSMARGGTYGDNMEITAFASAYDCDVKIYQRDFAYVVSSGEDGNNRPVAHIAYHLWEHYSSIRNLDGPHTGMPEVSPKVLSLQEEQIQKDKLAQTPHVLPWQIDNLSKSLPFLADKPTIKRALEATKGDINAAWEKLVGAEDNGSNSSYQESSSVERDNDSDDDSHDGPNKKQDRRMSRASRAPNQPRSTESTHALSKLATHDGSQETFASWESESSLSSAAESSQDTAPRSTTTSFDDSNIVVKQEAPKTSPSDAPARPPIRLKLLPPRPPAETTQQRNSKTQQRQNGPPRITARDRKDIKKQAQKAARKERQQAATKSGENPAQVKLSLRAKGATEKPPVDTLRTLYI